MADQALLRLLQLVSPSLPVGSYAWSHGLEAAQEYGWITDMESSYQWISGLLLDHQARVDAPLLWRLFEAISHADLAQAQRLNDQLLAQRETAELRFEDRQLGKALMRLLTDLHSADQPALLVIADCSFAAAFAQAAVSWGISAEDALAGYLWHYCESQVQAAIKLVPLGQTDGQRLLGRLQHDLQQASELAIGLTDVEIGSQCPALAIISSRHESQYSRLFRS